MPHRTKKSSQNKAENATNAKQTTISKELRDEKCTSALHCVKLVKYKKEKMKNIVEISNVGEVI